MVSPIGSGKAAIASSDCAMASMRTALSVNRSSRLGLSAPSRALLTSCWLAVRIVGAATRKAAAASPSARFLVSVGKVASRTAALRAAIPIVRRSDITKPARPCRRGAPVRRSRQNAHRMHWAIDRGPWPRVRRFLWQFPRLRRSRSCPPPRGPPPEAGCRRRAVPPPHRRRWSSVPATAARTQSRPCEPAAVAAALGSVCPSFIGRGHD